MSGREAREALALAGPYTRRFRAAFRRAAQGIVEAGAVLIEAREALPHGAWRAWIDEALPIGPRHAQRLMRIARDWRLQALAGGEAAHMHLRRQLLAGPGVEQMRLHESHLLDPEAPILPADVAILNDLAGLDDDALRGQLLAGVIRPGMTRGDLISGAIAARDEALPAPPAPPGRGAPLSRYPGRPAMGLRGLGRGRPCPRPGAPLSDDDIRRSGRAARRRSGGERRGALHVGASRAARPGGEFGADLGLEIRVYGVRLGEAALRARLLEFLARKYL